MQKKVYHHVNHQSIKHAKQDVYISFDEISLSGKSYSINQFIIPYSKKVRSRNQPVSRFKLNRKKSCISSNNVKIFQPVWPRFNFICGSIFSINNYKFASLQSN